MSNGNTLKFTKEQILQAIDGSGGIMSTIAKKLKVDWHTADTKVNLYEETKQAYANEKQKIIDMAEGVVFESVQQKDVQTAKWVLSTIGKKRGYSERVEVTGEDGSPLFDILKKNFMGE